MRILAVSHDTSRTGAPINFLHFLSWAVEKRDLVLRTLVLQDGPLRPQFEMLGAVRVPGSTFLDKVLRGLERYLKMYGNERFSRATRAIRHRMLLAGWGSADLAFLNSAASADVLLHLPRDLPVVVHVHELDIVLNTLLPEHLMSAFLRRPAHWIAASEAVQDALVRMGCDKSRISVHYEFIDVEEVASRQHTDLTLKTETLGIPPEAIVVVGSGTPGWRKGSDLFLQLAREVEHRSNHEIHFLWVGGDPESVEWVQFNAELRQLGSTRVHLIPETEDRFDWFSLASIFALTSREDPFPLVVLEHAVMGVPVVTYRNGGIVELLSDAGSEAAEGIVDYLDVGALAERVIQLALSEELRSLAAEQIRSRVVSMHDVNNCAPEIYAEAERVVAEFG